MACHECNLTHSKSKADSCETQKTGSGQVGATLATVRALSKSIKVSVVERES